jgi:hypothetical protein
MNSTSLSIYIEYSSEEEHERGSRRSSVVKALCNKSEGSGLQTRLGEYYPSNQLILQAALLSF